MRNRLHQECYARSCQEFEELKIRCNEEENTEKQRRLKNFLCSTIRNHVQWVYWEIKYEDYQDDSKIFYDPDWPSSHDSAHVPHQALITSNSTEPSRDIGLLRNTREDMSILGNFFDWQHAGRDSVNFTMIQEIWWHYWRFWEQKERAKNHCNQYLFPPFEREQDTMSRRWKVSYFYD